jgi:hypothetical protein
MTCRYFVLSRDTKRSPRSLKQWGRLTLCVYNLMLSSLVKQKLSDNHVPRSIRRESQPDPGICTTMPTTSLLVVLILARTALGVVPSNYIPSSNPSSLTLLFLLLPQILRQRWLCLCFDFTIEGSARCHYEDEPRLTVGRKDGIRSAGGVCGEL